MPAYNFKGRFADAVEQGTKPHTIRPRRKHPTKMGDTLYLYTGMRTRGCRLLRVATCTKVTPIVITAEFRVELGGRALSGVEKEKLAMRDGFASAMHFFLFFFETYGERFEGELIEWNPSASSAPSVLNESSLPGARAAGVQAECTPQVRALGAPAQVGAANLS